MCVVGGKLSVNSRRAVWQRNADTVLNFSVRPTMWLKIRARQVSPASMPPLHYGGTLVHHTTAALQNGEAPLRKAADVMRKPIFL